VLKRTTVHDEIQLVPFNIEVEAITRDPFSSGLLHCVGRVLVLLTRDE
jgi:hypothetical protein